MNYWIGQAFGILATIVGMLIPLFQKKWQMLAANLTNNLLLALNLVFLDRLGSGIFLFLVAMIQAAVNLIHCFRNTKVTKRENIIFLELYLGLGFYGLVSAPGFVPGINTRNLLELLPIAGAVTSMCFIAARNERQARWYYLSCSILWVIYYILIGSTSGLGSLFSIITGTIAIIKNRKK